MSSQVPIPRSAPLHLPTFSSNGRAIDLEGNAPPERAAGIEDIPPNGGYGWWCVAACFVLNACAWGINSAFGVFLAFYLANDTFPGATHFGFAFIGGLSISQALLISPLVNITTRLWGTRITLLIGVFFLSLGLLGASFATTFYQLLLAQGIAFGYGMGFLYVGSLSVIPQWFGRSRSLAMGIAASGAGFGGLAYNLSTQALIEAVGLAWTFRILAASAFAANTLSALVIRDRNKHVKPRQTAFDLRLFTRPEILLIVGWGCMSELGYIVLYYSLPNYAASVGLSPSQGSVAGALFSLGLAIGRPVIGFCSDRVGRITMAMLMTAFCGLLCLFVWTFAISYAVVLLFAIMAGTVAVAQPIAVKLISGTGNATPWLRPQLFVGFMFLGAALCTLGLRSWKVVSNIRKREQEITLDDTGADGGPRMELWANRSLVRRLIGHLQAALSMERV
ncbi:hypothetical protein PMZ80_005593 [Knufia obscura]|uniref:Uncharacterized protein n=1 Tax=Knufia obscura TaxID=1635080 RepID=A0ABR0RN41_9EURO|nr:hypothetical protein PMZ80_005593 [Knufia obscura]